MGKKGSYYDHKFLEGEKFGDWLVVDPTVRVIDKSKKTKVKGVLVRCEHTEKMVSIYHLLKGDSRGCKECGAKRKFKGCGDLAGSYLNSVQIGAKKRNIVYDVTPEYLWELFVSQNERCAISGINIKLDPKFSVAHTTKIYTQTASLDRIDSSAGYVAGNVQWVHKTINLMKRDLNQGELIDWCVKVADYTHAQPQISEKQRTKVFSRFKLEGIHRWRKCPIDEVSYLRDYHRHVFHFEVRAYVSHSDRDIEFIQFSHQVEQFLKDKYYCDTHGCCFFDDMSCEMLGEEIVARFPIYEAIVSEDGEGGSIVTKL